MSESVSRSVTCCLLYGGPYNYRHVYSFYMLCGYSKNCTHTCWQYIYLYIIYIYAGCRSLMHAAERVVLWTSRAARAISRVSLNQTWERRRCKPTSDITTPYRNTGDRIAVTRYNMNAVFLRVSLFLRKATISDDYSFCNIY